jgi:hypothetical protein
MMTGNEPVSTEENDPKTKAEFLRSAIKRAERARTYWDKNFQVARNDLLFLYGENQWDAEAAKQREAEGRPMLKLNQLPQYKRQVVNDMRRSTPRISVIPYHADFKPKGGKMEQDKIKNLPGTKDYSRAEVFEGLIRNIENNSLADRHYDRAGQHAVESGFGWLRVKTHYQNLDSFDQDAKISSLTNRFAVLCDPDYEEPDTTDKNYLFIGDKMPKDEFRVKYPEGSLGELSGLTGDEYNWWYEDDYVRVAEYFYRKPATRVLLLLSDGKVVFKDQIEPVLDELKEKGIGIVQQRKVKTWKVCWAKITGNSILEGGPDNEIEWPGTIIPVVPVFGEEFTFGDKTMYLGLTHFAEDSQRMCNYWWTAATEKVALSPKAPWVGSDEAVEGHETQWENANRGNPSFLKYNQYDSQGQKIDAPQRSDFAAMPAAEIQLALAATDLTKSTLGMYDASLGQRSNETSGTAINARKEESDSGNFHFVDNRDMAIAAVGRILLEVIPRIYDNERVLRLMFEDGQGDWVSVNETITDEQTGKKILVHDMSVGKFDVIVTAGPAYATQRQEAVDSMLRVVSAVPEMGKVLLDLIAENMDWHLSKEASRRLKLMLPREMLTPEDKEQLGLDDKQPEMTPEQQAEVAKAQADTETAKADAAKEAEKTKQSGISLEIERERSKQAQLEYNKIKEQAMLGKPDYQVVAKMVADAMAEIKLTEFNAAGQTR